jgi:hypothetical protein
VKLPPRAAEKPREKWTFADEMAAREASKHDALQQVELLCADWGGVREDIYSNFSLAFPGSYCTLYQVIELRSTGWWRHAPPIDDRLWTARSQVVTALKPKREDDSNHQEAFESPTLRSNAPGRSRSSTDAPRTPFTYHPPSPGKK